MHTTGFSCPHCGGRLAVVPDRSVEYPIAGALPPPEVRQEWERVRQQVRALAGRLKALREKFGLTQVEFAKAIGVSRTALAEMEAGNSKPSVTMIIGVVFAFPDVDKKWLMKGDVPDEPFAADQ
jgi:DNA-binding XRE family transcriptional regulator